MPVELLYALEVILNGLMAGVLYSLVALGFVLIFKASGVFNYAQGIMALFAALTLVGFQDGQIPFSHLINAIFGTEIHHFGWHLPALLATIFALGVMLGFAVLVERLILKHLVNQEPIILFMATIGLGYFMEGFGDLMWGSDIKKMDVGLPQGGSFWLEDLSINWAAEGSDYFGMYIDVLDVWAAVVAIVLVAALSAFSQYTKAGRALRAVADDHQAALSVGISLRTIWVMTWAIAGFVALVAGIMWGSKSGVQFSLSLIALKALPVLLLGGFTSIPGAIVGGLIIGVGE
ncbi:MAG: branched-chain amino acid ABC transporter permease, partial [Pseudomonadota bacterium]